MILSCAAGHCRFATSSIPTAAESHPHQWTPSSTVTVWLPTHTQTQASGPTPTCTPSPNPISTPTRPDDSRHLPRACKDSSKELLEAGFIRSDSWQDQPITTPYPTPTPTPVPAPAPTPTPPSWQLKPISTPHGVFVTHNGDFECYKLFGQKQTTAEVMDWLSSVLHVAPPASCDSLAIAGVTPVIPYFKLQGSPHNP